MTKLDELINELCPDGVEWKELKDISIMQRGTSVTKKDVVVGEVPVISGGKQPAYYCDKFNRDGETITIAGSGGAGYVQYWDIPIFVCDAFSVKATLNNSTKYLFYCLKNIQAYIYSTKKGGGVPHVYISSINKVQIPLPPLAVQREIVRILDNFTELTAELTARKKQYAYYRDNLLTFGEGVEWKTLGTTINLSRGVRVVRSQLNNQGKYPVYQNSMTPLGYFDESNYQAETTFIISAGAAGSVGYSDIDFWAADDCYCLGCPEGLNSRYLYHALTNQQDYIFSQVRRASVPRIGRDVVERIKIPLPPLPEQQRIVAILDQFDTLCNDISQGLPAEIQARKKQYEYYRDKLLTFQKLDTQL